MPSGIGSGPTSVAGSPLTSLSGSLPIVGGIINTVLGGILQHARRAKGAKNEAAATASATVQFDQQLKQINDGYNNGSLSPSDALQGLEYIGQQFYQDVAPYGGQPGTASRPCNTLRVQPLTEGSVNYIQGAGDTVCDKLCTAACCVGCGVIMPAVAAATQVVQQGGGNSWINEVFPSKYNTFSRAGYGLTWDQSNATPITAISGLGNQFLGTIEDAFSSITGGGVNGGPAGQRTSATVSVISTPMILIIAVLILGLFFGLGRK